MTTDEADLYADLYGSSASAMTAPAPAATSQETTPPPPQQQPPAPGDDDDDEGLEVVLDSAMLDQHLGAFGFQQGTGVSAAAGSVPRPPLGIQLAQPQQPLTPLPRTNSSGALPQPLLPVPMPGGRSPAPPVSASSGVPAAVLNLGMSPAMAMAVGLTQPPARFLADIDMLDERPWQKPGADLSDYFNYGFVETTWRAYSYRQMMLRAEQKMQGKIKEYDGAASSQRGPSPPQQPPKPLPVIPPEMADVPPEIIAVMEPDSRAGDRDRMAAMPGVLRQPMVPMAAMQMMYARMQQQMQMQQQQQQQQQREESPRGDVEREKTPERYDDHRDQPTPEGLRPEDIQPREEALHEKPTEIAPTAAEERPEQSPPQRESRDNDHGHRGSKSKSPERQRRRREDAEEGRDIGGGRKERSHGEHEREHEGSSKRHRENERRPGREHEERSSKDHESSRGRDLKDHNHRGDHDRHDDHDRRRESKGDRVHRRTTREDSSRRERK